MEKKPDTPSRIARRNYEERNKAWRKSQNATFSTTISRIEIEKINEFLKKNNITKADLIRLGFENMKKQLNNKTE